MDTPHPLKTWRDANGWSQARFGEAVNGRTGMAVSRWESGALPEKEDLQRIIELTGGAVTPNAWFTLPAGGAPASTPKRNGHGSTSQGRRRNKTAPAKEAARRR